ncbi:coiled-coil domain-containing protein [Nocardioides ultimimeridianus]
MATGPVDAQPDALRNEYDALVRRHAQTQAELEQAQAELADARLRIAALEARAAAAEGPLSIFEGGSDPGGRLTGDGSDPRVLSFVLGATAVVSGMVAVLALLNGTLMTPFGLLIAALTAVLAWAALRTKVEPIEVSIVRGLVYVKKGETSYRFDVRSASTEVEQHGTPGEPGWELRFARKGMDPFVIDASMVEPVSFMAELRQWRSTL